MASIALRCARVGGLAILATLLSSGSQARAQGWDYGRNMFGFSQHYPGSGWSSYYRPGFDPDAWYPTTVGVSSSHHNGGNHAPRLYVNSPMHAAAADRDGNFYATYRGSKGVVPLPGTTRRRLWRRR